MKIIFGVKGGGPYCSGAIYCEQCNFSVPFEKYGRMCIFLIVKNTVEKKPILHRCSNSFIILWGMNEEFQAPSLSWCDFLYCKQCFFKTEHYRRRCVFRIIQDKMINVRFGGE